MVSAHLNRPLQHLRPNSKRSDLLPIRLRPGPFPALRQLAGRSHFLRTSYFFCGTVKRRGAEAGTTDPRQVDHRRLRVEKLSKWRASEFGDFLCAGCNERTPFMLGTTVRYTPINKVRMDSPYNCLLGQKGRKGGGLGVTRAGACVSHKFSSGHRP